jgi:hypothetical protein
MYIASRIVNGRTYYRVEECRRVKGRKRTRVLAYLGPHPTVEGAFRDHEARYFAARKGRRRGPLTAADRRLWERVEKLAALLRLKRRGFPFSAAYRAEARRHARLKEEEEFDAWLAEMDAADRDDYETLGLPGDATRAQIKAAYHRKAREHHPDHGGDGSAMAAVNAAYDRLMGD